MDYLRFKTHILKKIPRQFLYRTFIKSKKCLFLQKKMKDGKQRTVCADSDLIVERGGAEGVAICNL